MEKTNKKLIDGVQVNLDVLASENKSLDELKTRDIFPEGPTQAASYEALWNEVQKVEPKEVKVTVEEVSSKKKKKA